jgi:hypothetical protein
MWEDAGCLGTVRPADIIFSLSRWRCSLPCPALIFISWCNFPHFLRVTNCLPIWFAPRLKSPDGTSLITSLDVNSPTFCRRRSTPSSRHIFITDRTTLYVDMPKSFTHRRSTCSEWRSARRHRLPGCIGRWVMYRQGRWFIYSQRQGNKWTDASDSFISDATAEKLDLGLGLESAGIILALAHASFSARPISPRLLLVLAIPSSVRLRIWDTSCWMRIDLSEWSLVDCNWPSPQMDQL